MITETRTWNAFGWDIIILAILIYVYYIFSSIREKYRNDQLPVTYPEGNNVKHPQDKGALPSDETMLNNN